MFGGWADTLQLIKHRHMQYTHKHSQIHIKNTMAYFWYLNIERFFCVGKMGENWKHLFRRS